MLYNERNKIMSVANNLDKLNKLNELLDPLLSQLDFTVPEEYIYVFNESKDGTDPTFKYKTMFMFLYENFDIITFFLLVKRICELHPIAIGSLNTLIYLKDTNTATSLLTMIFDKYLTMMKKINNSDNPQLKELVTLEYKRLICNLVEYFGVELKYRDDCTFSSYVIDKISTDFTKEDAVFFYKVY